MLRYIAGAALVLAAASAVAVARRRRDHAPVAYYLVTIAAAWLVGLPLALLPDGRVVWIARSSLWTLDSFALPWMVGNVIAPPVWKESRVASPVWGLVVPWLAVSALVARAPTDLRVFYTAIECASLFICVVHVVMGLRHGGGPLARLRASTLTERVTLCLVGASFALLFVGGWSLGLWGAAWRPQQAGLVALYGGLAIVQGLAWRRAGSAP